MAIRIARRARTSLKGGNKWFIRSMPNQPTGSWMPVMTLRFFRRWLRANGEKAGVGWPNIPEVETEIAAWYDANTLDEEKTIARRLNKAALDHVVYAPLGWYMQYTAWRKNVSGVIQAPLPFFWGVSKTV
jgi:ABC-type transport system substrate-binding protein